MNPTRPIPRRPRTPSLAPERLESRELMTGGVGNTFAIIPATITKAGGHAQVSFNLNPALFTDKGNKPFVLGIDVASNKASTAQPIIRSVVTPTGQTLGVQHSTFDPTVKRSTTNVNSTLSTAALVTIPGLPAKTATSTTYKVNVDSLGKTSGSILVGFYLPGNAGGSGVVTQSDLNAIKYGMNTNANDKTGKYSFDADTNRDGRITQADLAIATKNLGIGTTISPVISANVAPSQLVNSTARTTNKPNVIVTGAATPNSVITFAETGVSPTITTATSTGAYTLNLPLLTGANSFHVSTSDGFNQKISGSINSITYDVNAQPNTVTAVATNATNAGLKA